MDEDLKREYLEAAHDLLVAEGESDITVIGDLLIISSIDTYQNKPVLDVYSFSDYLNKLEKVRSKHLSTFGDEYKDVGMDMLWDVLFDEMVEAARCANQLY